MGLIAPFEVIPALPRPTARSKSWVTARSSGSVASRVRNSGPATASNASSVRSS
ncbi:hypothetical protein [Halegenticoccus tardaugens]|uniref:hypothetical protein n=1 Tax=Halegenticoccus tardaugens TaxID=2071624 RepID=UPI0013E97C60|nr:hypothetical protein [Halegenticoccus tardaugens]